MIAFLNVTSHGDFHLTETFSHVFTLRFSEETPAGRLFCYIFIDY